MPLEHSAGKEAVGRNIKREESAGKPHKQAVAIALNTAREAGADIPKPKAMSALDDTAGATLIGEKRDAMVAENSVTDEAYNPAPRLASVTEVDTGLCTVRAILCTDVVDTYGDAIDPPGIQLAMHRDNPVVMYQHGIGVGGPDSPGHILPVARAEDDQGNYLVNLVGDVLMGAARFSQSDPFAQQVFRLYAEKILRGFSVNVIPIYGAWERIEDKKLPGGKAKACYRYQKTWLKEFSACPIPVNPEALTIAVERGSVAGERLCPILRASLFPYCLPKSDNVSFGVTISRATSQEATNMSAEHTDGGGESDKTGHESHDKEKEAEKKEDEKQEEDELKAGPKGHLDGLQMTRDHRIENAKHHAATEDPEALEAHEEIDGHLARAEDVHREYLIGKGHKEGDLPGPASFDEIKAMCKGEHGGGEMVMRGSSYKPPRFRTFGPASPAGTITISKAEYDAGLAKAKLFQSRLRRSRVTA